MNRPGRFSTAGRWYSSSSRSSPSRGGSDGGAVCRCQRAPPALNVSPHGNLTDGQTVSVSVGSNGFFTPHARSEHPRMRRPRGTSSQPAQGRHDLRREHHSGRHPSGGGDGSFSDPSYPVSALPSATLGEQGNNQPICDQTHYCVLFVGQNQNDFTVPKVFSAPFLIAPSSGPPHPRPGATSTRRLERGSPRPAISVHCIGVRRTSARPPPLSPRPTSGPWPIRVHPPKRNGLPLSGLLSAHRRSGTPFRSSGRA